MKKQLFYWLAAFAIVVVGCQKELSFEGSNTPAKGSLQSDVTGDCLPKTVNGLYLAGSSLVPATNTISVQVNVATTGTYVVSSDTINGFFFRATGIFTTLGANNIILRGYGTPFAAGVNNFVVSFDTTFCDIQVNVVSPGIGTLAGAPNACAPIKVNGAYSPGVALSASNNAVIQVNVLTAGIFNISTDTVAGVWFTYAGTLSTTGLQDVTLQAQGSIPAATMVGAKMFTVKLGAGRCTFVVNVAAPAAGTVDCSAAVISGTYTVGVAMIASDSVQISVTVITPGAYNISTDTVSGIWFNTSGVFTATTTTTITLIAHGTPSGSGGPTMFTVKFGSSTCTFSVTIVGPPAIDWKFNIGSTVYQGTTTPGMVTYDNTSFPPFSFFIYFGDNPAGDNIGFSLGDIAGSGIFANETYNTNAATTSNNASFTFQDGAGTLDLIAQPGTTPAVNILFKITSHNTATKTIIGTFTGTAYDNLSSTIKNITFGTFTAVYP